MSRFTETVVIKKGAVRVGEGERAAMFISETETRLHGGISRG